MPDLEKPITTQEQLDQIISGRLERERQKYADYEVLKTSVGKLTTDIDAERAKNAGFEKTIAELNGKVKKYENDSVKSALLAKKGLPTELVSRISGATQEEIEKDVDALAEIIGQKNPAPGYQPEEKNDKAEDAAWKKLVSGLERKE